MAKMSKHPVVKSDDNARQAEAEKTMHLPALRDAVAAKVWNLDTIYISENGTSAADGPAADGSVYDLDRIMYLRNYLAQLQRATSEGVPVLGYFLWTLMDNFEWSDGYEQRFGLYHVDFDTRRRTPKLSAAFYRETIARNAVA